MRTHDARVDATGGAALDSRTATSVQDARQGIPGGRWPSTGENGVAPAGSYAQRPSSLMTRGAKGQER